MSSPTQIRLLPYALPDRPVARIQLIAIRRMAAHGLHDAQASLLMLRWFGLDYRRKLVLLRALIHELAQISRRTIQLAPCCAGRMTADEALLIRVLEQVGADPADAASAMTELTQNDAICQPLTLAAMLCRPRCG